MYCEIINSFIKSLRALKVYIESVEQVIHDVDDDTQFENDRLLAQIFYSVLKIKNSNKDFKEECYSSEKIKEIFEQGLKEYGAVEAEQKMDDIFKTFEEIASFSERDEITGKYQYKSLPKNIRKKYEELEVYGKQRSILYSGTLMLLVTYYENLISRVFRCDFARHPERIKLDAKAVTYKFLLEVNNVEEVKNHLIDEEVMSMMYKSHGDWMCYLENIIKLKLPCINDNKDRISEIIARRNLFVHNDGKVNSVYLGIISNSEFKRGEEIIISKEYLSNAIDIIEMAGVSLVVELSLKEKWSDSNEIDKIECMIYDEFFSAEKFENSRILYEIGLDSSKINQTTKLDFLFNNWCSYKLLGKFNLVEKQVKEFDVSAYKPRYLLAKLALLDKYQDFFVEYDRQDDLNDNMLKEWTIFKNVRTSEEFKRRFETSLETVHSAISNVDVNLDMEMEEACQQK